MSAVLITVILIVTGVVVAPLAQGFVISVLWLWFVVPIFHLPAIPIINAVGIALIARIIITPDYTAQEEKYKNSSLPTLLGLLFSKAVGEPLAVLAIGWVFKSLM